MSNDHPATPQGLPTTTWDAPRTSQMFPASPKGPSGSIQIPPCDATRTLNGSPGMHQRAPRLSRDRHGTMRTLKCRTDLTRDVLKVILRREKHDFLQGEQHWTFPRLRPVSWRILSLLLKMRNPYFNFIYEMAAKSKISRNLKITIIVNCHI